MSYRSYQYRGSGGYGGGGAINIFGPLPPTVMYLIIANVVMYVITIFIPRPSPFSLDYLSSFLALVPEKVFPGLQLWRVATYLFLHGDFSHILFNMLTLWWFGGPLEQVWGRDRFLTYYFLCGIGAGFFCVPFYYLTGTPGAPIMGASGALFGVLMAFALIYPNARILLFFIMPIRAKWLVIFWMIMEFAATASQLGGGRSAVASIAHLSGMLIGYFYLRRLMDIKAYYQKLKQGGKKRPYRVIPGDDDQGPWLH